MTGAAIQRLAAAWDRHWFGPIAAVRPYLLLRLVPALIAFDLWTFRIPAGAVYQGFNVAHFAWLDALQPPPTPGLYVGLLLAVGLLGLVAALAEPPRWVRALVALGYTWGWAMSLRDSFQHHYLISLILAALVFFPRVRARDLEAPSSPGIRAWAYALLGANMGIVYAYTAMTKLDEEFHGGQIMAYLGRKGPFAAAAGWLGGLGISPALFWSVQALGVFALEGLVAVGYVVAVRLDRGPGRPLRALAWLAWLAAVGLHVTVEVALSLRIGWFSYYMLLFACVYFLPGRWLRTLATPLIWPAARLDAWWDRARLSPLLTWLAAATAALVIVLVGSSVDLPGAHAVGLLGAGAVLGTTLVAWALGRPQRAAPPVLAAGVAALLLWGFLQVSLARPRYYVLLGIDMQREGNLPGALRAFARANRDLPPALKVRVLSPGRPPESAVAPPLLREDP